MIPPLSLFWILIASLHVERIIRWPLLLTAAAQHGGYAEAHRLHRQRRRPVLCQDGQADVAIAVDMRMHRYVAANERDLPMAIISKLVSQLIDIDNVRALTSGESKGYLLLNLNSN